MSSPFNLEASLARARQRFGQPSGKKRKTRSDRGKLRISEEAAAQLRQLLDGVDYLGVPKILKALSHSCRQRGVPCPARATVYSFMARDPGPSYLIESLPLPVQDALYNLGGSESVPGAQLVFYCLNYGDLTAIQYAAAMPWWPLYQAARMRGWRPKSRGLLSAVLRARGISRG